ncbi:hypothetical protein ACFL0O_00300 [Thermodesulfobacteriota bacterium]
MHVIERFQAMASYLRGKCLNEIFPGRFMKNLVYAKYPPYHCIGCGVPMTHDQMNPPDRITPRAMCTACWEKWRQWIEAQERCLVCFDVLSDDKFGNFLDNPYDLHNRLCVGRCADYFSLMSAYALGYDTGIRDIPQHQAYPQVQRINRDQHLMAPLPNASDVIDVPFQEIPQRKPFALPPPDDSLKVPSNFRKWRHNEKEVEFVPLKRR